MRFSIRCALCESKECQRFLVHLDRSGRGSIDFRFRTGRCVRSGLWCATCKWIAPSHIKKSSKCNFNGFHLSSTKHIALHSTTPNQLTSRNIWLCRRNRRQPSWWPFVSADSAFGWSTSRCAFTFLHKHLKFPTTIVLKKRFRIPPLDRRPAIHYGIVQQIQSMQF